MSGPWTTCGIDIDGFNGILVRSTIPPLWLGLRTDPASPFLVQIVSELDDQYPDTVTWQFWNGEQCEHPDERGPRIPFGSTAP
ncbi:hypothetical protein [Streptomyces sp. NPDC057302]|uniref:hypothetical protein n=1 Tax=Streptomyces sp. NPDC057302 TaxID=3346094 RepID=UPI00363A3E3C